MQRGGERWPIGQIAGNDLAVEVGEIVARTAGPHEGAHLRPTSDERPRDGRPEKAGSASYQDAITRLQRGAHQRFSRRTFWPTAG